MKRYLWSRYFVNTIDLDGTKKAQVIQSKHSLLTHSHLVNIAEYLCDEDGKNVFIENISKVS